MLKPNEIYTGDCLELIKSLDNNSIDLVWFSPPYWNLHKYSNEAKEIGNNQSLDAYLKCLIDLSNECFRVLKPTGNLVINIMDLVRENKPLLLSDKLIYSIQNFLLVEKIVWHIRNKMPVASNKRLVNKYEWLIHWGKSDDYFVDIDAVREPHSEYAAKDKRKWKWNIKGKNCGNMWDIPAYRVSGKRKFHQAAFPIELSGRVVKCWCPEGGIVLDPFVGSGTTCISAQKLNRQHIGFELSPEYAEIARERLNTKDLFYLIK